MCCGSDVVVLLAVSELVVMETVATVSVVVELQGQSSSNVSVTLATVNGTAMGELCQQSHTLYAGE